MVSSRSTFKKVEQSGSKPSRKEGEGSSSAQGSSTSTVCLTIYVFRGEPDVYQNRHVLVYFTSPENPDFHETVHAQRRDDNSPWVVDQIHSEMDWVMTRTYLSHVNAGAVLVTKGQEMWPVDIVASTPVEGRHEHSDWNCQHFLLEGLQSIVAHGLQTMEWYEYVLDELTTILIEGTVG